METLVWISIWAVAAISCGGKAFYYFFTPRDDLYSNYRNSRDTSVRHFAYFLTIKRIVWGISFIISSGLFLYTML